MNVMPGAQEREAFADALPRLYWDTAVRQRLSVPARRISIAGLRRIENTAELDDDERSGVLGASAARLIPRLAQVSHQRV
jgi:hypothetical protein